MSRSENRQAATDVVEAALSTGAEALFARQNHNGVFESSTHRASPFNTAIAITALHFADPAGSAGHIARGLAWLARDQRADGGWAMPGVPTEPLTTAIVTAVLELLGGADATVRAGHACLAAHGGIEAIAPEMIGLVRQFQSLAGTFDPERERRLPLELLLFPKFSRQVLSLRLPMFASSALAQSVHRRQSPVRRRVNRLLRPVALKLVRQVYEGGGATGGFSTDTAMTGIVCTGLARSGMAPDIVAKSVHWLRTMAHADGHWDLMPLDITWSQFAATGLCAAGHAGDTRLTTTWKMLRDRQNVRPFPMFGCPPGYWGFSGTESLPMALESAEVGSLLARLAGRQADDHVRRGVEWLTAMQDSAGSWSLSVRDSKPGRFGPCPYMTAKSVIALLDSGVGPDDVRVRKALRWLTTRQRADGSFEALWYRGDTPGTAVVLEALVRAGQGNSAVAGKAVDWLLGAHDDTVEETAWALRALATAGVDHPVVRAATHQLLDAQLPDGTWPSGPVHEYIRGCLRYTDTVLATGLALRALSAVRHRGVS